MVHSKWERGQMRKWRTQDTLKTMMSEPVIPWDKDLFQVCYHDSNILQRTDHTHKWIFSWKVVNLIKTWLGWRVPGTSDIIYYYQNIICWQAYCHEIKFQLSYNYKQYKLFTYNESRMSKWCLNNEHRNT